MRIAFFAPHKPVDHPVPSGDLMIARGLRDFLIDSGHRVEIASRERLWKIIESPERWPSVFFEYGRILERMEKFRPDLWITYHSYHKSPDLYGPEISQRLGIPYVIYQGVFATKYRRNFKTWPGYMANKKALLYSDHVFANKEIDFCNLSRIIIPEKLSRTYPGINTDEFSFCQQSRKDVRNQMGLDKQITLISVAMLREDVKAESITDLIQAFGIAAGDNPDIRLLIAGDGEARTRLEKLAGKVAGGKIVFLGSVPRKELFRYYSAADIFAFPGINEALGMVYLEAQCAGLPVVAYSTRGPSEAAAHMETGLLSPQGDIQALAENITELVRNTELRERMKKAAPKRIKRIFDLRSNLAQVEKQLLKLI